MPARHNDVLKKLKKLTDQLDAAESSTKETLEEVKRAQKTVDKTKRAVRIKQNPDYTTPKRKRSKHR